MLISRGARDKYQFDQDLFLRNGRLALPDLAAARRFAGTMTTGGLQPIAASDVLAICLLDEVFRSIVNHYHEGFPEAFSRAEAHLESAFGRRLMEDMADFLDEFPPQDLYLRLSSAPESAGAASLEELQSGPILTALLSELILVRLHRENPSVRPCSEFFRVSSAPRERAFAEIVAELERALEHPDSQRLGLRSQSVFRALRAPIEVSPHSLHGQLQFLIAEW